MKTRAIALAALLCSGAALAQNPLGDDSGPNAHDGQCDDTRFENIGAGNSNVVFWEGGRYDGRDATDCRDLLLQGLINWRDGVDPRVDRVLATGDFGDDSGPNANNGECDDTRFENIGAGNSNIVFWEGGRYDGQDATDCADLLLQGLIAWRRDTAVAGVPAEPATPTVADAQRQPATALPEGVTEESICTVNSEDECWMELPGVADCYIRYPYPQLEFDTWSGQCSSGLGAGTAVFRRYADNGEEEGVLEFPYVSGEVHGTAVARWNNWGVVETPYVNGRPHGTQVYRWTNGDVLETPFVNGVEHGIAIRRNADGSVDETPWVNGERHGTEVVLFSDGAVRERPYVNGEVHGTVVTRWADGGVSYSCFAYDRRISDGAC